jgi:hypothetical protein
MNQEKIKILSHFCLTRPLDGLNLLQAKSILEILQELQEKPKETAEEEKQG